MEWIRRRSKAPGLAALLLLCGLTLVAPKCWELLHQADDAAQAPEPTPNIDAYANRRTPAANAEQRTNPSGSSLTQNWPNATLGDESAESDVIATSTRQGTTASAETTANTAVTPASDEEPVRRSSGAQPIGVTMLADVSPSCDQAALAAISPAMPLLEDDYALVDNPLPNRTLVGAHAISNSAESMSSMLPLGSASTPPLPPRRVPQDARPEPPAPPTIEPRQELDLTKLLAARDALCSLLGQLREIELPEWPPAPQAQPAAAPADAGEQQPATTANVEPQPLRARKVAEPTTAPAETAARTPATRVVVEPAPVRVENPTDRLAMRPTQLPAAKPPALRLVPAGPTRIVEAAKPATEQTAPRVALRDETEPKPKPLPTPKPEPPLLRLKPVALMRQLEQAAAEPVSAAWAAEALAAMTPLTTPGGPVDEAAGAVRELDRLARRGLDESLALADPAMQRIGIRAARSISRRIPVWQALVDAQADGTAKLSNDSTNPLASEESLQRVLDEFAATTAGSDAGLAWREYLMLDDIAALASVAGSDQPDRRRTVARRVIGRLDNPNMTDAQRDFLAESPAAALAAALRPWATDTVDLSIFAALIERYELRGAQRDADLIAELLARLAFSPDARQQQLAAQLDRFYRNGNMRLAVTGDLLNRLTPQPEPSNSRVHDNVAGAEVRGRAQTTTKLEVRMLPDPEVWRFGLEASGTVSSQTRSETWPARIRNKAQIDYEARKLILINQHGLHVWPAEAKTGKNQNRMTGVDNSLDVVPLVGPLVEGYAERQHRERRPRAMSEVKRKVQQEARRRLDRETDAKLQVMEEKFAQTVLAPLEQLALAVEPLQMYTTNQRAVMRMRLADDAQLGAHTPRPSAPGDSLASAQLHESALNNAARGLGLDGREFSSLELYERLAEQLGRSIEPPDPDFPSRATVRFAKSDAVRIRCRDDRVELVLTIDELSQGRDHIRGVQVHAFFRPVVEGLTLKLVREDSLQFDGQRLLTGARIVLHSVFGKLLPKDQEIVILAPRVENDPRFAGLMVTQLVIEDGWLAMALGPKAPERTAWRTEVASERPQ